MGRGVGEQQGQTIGANRRTKTPEEEALSRFEWHVGSLEMRSSRAARASEGDQVDQDEAKARSLRYLANQGGVLDQQKLIQAVQFSTNLKEQLADDDSQEAKQMIHRATNIENRARELYMLIHNGFIRNFISKYVNQLESESNESSLQTLRQYARIGTSKAMDRYQFDMGANPLTYTRQWIRAEVTEGIEKEGRLIRLKAKSHDLAKKVQAAYKQIQNEGRTPTIVEIAQMVKAPVHKVAEVMPYATQSTTRLDAPISADGEETIGGIIEDARADMNRPVEYEDMQLRVRKAVKSLESPYQRRVIELLFGLADNEEVDQKDLFDGVYRDPKTQELFSAEASVLSDRTKRGIKVTKMSQKVLNDRFAKGEVQFEPGTPESEELSRIVMDGYDATQSFDGTITRLTGIPPTSGTIQEAKNKAAYILSDNPALEGLEPRYRGDNALENSLSARKEVRDALVSLGVMHSKQAESTKAGKSGGRSKGQLRILAEKHGLVDTSSGRLKADGIEKALDQA